MKYIKVSQILQHKEKVNEHKHTLNKISNNQRDNKIKKNKTTVFNMENLFI